MHSEQTRPVAMLRLEVFVVKSFEQKKTVGDFVCECYWYLSWLVQEILMSAAQTKMMPNKLSLNSYPI